MGALALAAPRETKLVFACEAGNDLYRALPGFPRCETAAEAVAAAPAGAGVLLLAGGAPDREAVLKKKLRVYWEYPPGETRTARLERAVVASDAFGPDLERMRILSLHACPFVHFSPRPADLVLARVAGFDRAVYGLPQKDVYPILFEQDGMLVAAARLSRFISARYAPSEAWAAVWKRILQWLGAAQAVRWTPSVRPTYGRTDALPAVVEDRAFRRGVAAYSAARLFVHPSWKQEYERRSPVNDSVAPMPPADWPQGDGGEGVLEGFSSHLNADGTQPIRWMVRDDCVGEVSFALALAGDTRRAANLNDYIYRHRSDPSSSSYGLLGWSYPTSPGVYYGDDNARSMLGTMGTSGVLGSDRWDEGLLRCLLANLRTTGRLGFRKSRLDREPLERNGWRSYRDAENTNYAPHYVAYLWACFLWAYHKTRHQPFLDLTRNAIKMTMAAYPDQWRWTNGIQQERARMLLPLAWLVRVQDTAEHRGWLRSMAAEMLRAQDACGAIREELGPPGKGAYPPPKSNEDYGKTEATLLSANGDPVADMLYTSNFAFLGLHEAAAATREPVYIQASGKLAGLLCRIQTRSERHPELDGWWYRAFDFRRWDYWGSNADAGWGAWSTETGWTQAWIASVLGMRGKGTSLWEISSGSRIGVHLARLLPEMFPASAMAGPPE